MKGQTEVVGYILVFLLATIIVSSAFLWGMPLLTKRKDMKKIEDVRNFMRELATKIEDVSKGSLTKESEEVNVPGTFYFYPYNHTGLNNTIIFSFYTNAIDIPLTDEWIYIDTSNIRDEPYAVIGIDEPYVLACRAEKQGSGFNVECMAKFRGLINKNGEVYKIVLVDPSGDSGIKKSTYGKINIKSGNSYETTINSRTYFLSEVLIYL